MNKELRYKGNNPSHFFRDNTFNEMANLGWGKYCIHIKGKWAPSNNILDGDSLLSYLELIKVVLDNMEREGT